MDKNIYEMKLHESIVIGYYEILRVPGGWVYTHFEEDAKIESSVFVPFNNEFQIVTKTEDDDLPY